MGFPFAYLASFFETLESLAQHDPPLLHKEKTARTQAETIKWFKTRRQAIDDLNVSAAVALLSAVLPARRTDRVYGIQSPSLCHILSRSLGLSSSRAKDLQAWRQPGRGDLAQCLERVLKAGGPPARPAVTLEEVDDLLFRLAQHSRLSDPSLRYKLPPSFEGRDKMIGDVCKRCSPGEAKWLVRLILKDLSPVQVGDDLVLQSYHFLLPHLLRFQDDFASAIWLLKEDFQLRQLPAQPDPRSERVFKIQAAQLLRPVVGIKVGRPRFAKARSIDHCVKMLAGRKWVVERKYDGEYCEVHINLRNAQKIKIFSKSGKDSTADRRDLHQVLTECLRLGQPDCKIQKEAILLGELVVYCDATKTVMPFEELRKHVTRSGFALGANPDPLPRANEHLAIVFFDVLLVDEEIIMNKIVDERRRRLREVYRKIPGRAMSAEWKVVDFSRRETAVNHLMQQFSASIAERCEGLVLKPCDVPYFDLDADSTDHWRGYIKLKKDYIAGLGDEADFAVVGATYNARHALRCGMPMIKWTEFHLGCLINEAEVRRYNAKPHYMVVYTLTPDGCLPKPILHELNTLAYATATTYEPNAETMPLELTRLTGTNLEVVFQEPMVLEVLGAGFVKPPNCSSYMLRHPRATKLYHDRSWRDCVTFEALQEQARLARAAPVAGELVETREWLAKIQRKLTRRLEREGTTTPLSRRKSKSPSTGQLDETPLVLSTSLRRKRPLIAESKLTPCPMSKRSRISVSNPLATGMMSATSSTNLSCSPLTDITNGAPRPGHSRLQEWQHQPTLKPSSHKPPASSLYANPNTSLNDIAIYLPLSLKPISSIILPNLFSSTPTLALTSDLTHWNRNSFAYPPNSAIVSESPAYETMRKVVLVDPTKGDEVRDVVGKLLELNEGRWKERVEFWDWKLLEAEPRGMETSGDRSLIGLVEFDEKAGRGVFVQRRELICEVT